MGGKMCFLALTYVMNVSPTVKCLWFCEWDRIDVSLSTESCNDVMTSQTDTQEEEELMFLKWSNLLIQLQLAVNVRSKAFM